MSISIAASIYGQGWPGSMSARARSFCRSRRNALRAPALAILPRAAMARPSKEPPIASPLVPAIVRHAAAQGLDVEALGARFGLPAGSGELPEVLVPAHAPEELLHAIDRALQQPDVALRVAAAFASRALELLRLAVQASPRARDALSLLARAVPLVHPELEASLREEAGLVVWALRAPRRVRGAGRYVHETALAFALHRLRDAGAAAHPTRVWFLHPRPAHVEPLRAFLGPCDVSFGADDTGLALPVSDADAPMPRADARAFAALAPLVEAELARAPRDASFAERVAAHVAASLPAATDVAAVGRALHMSARTLQRRLEQEGTQFSEVLDRARLDAARRMLQDPAASLSAIAADLGFADLATFSRAFKRWTGTPPGQWRRL
jgi:AraC-like DNA-binding protein